ncbi:MAG: DUF3899 domain-containing protein [Firmicutes bacterium]|nr:DUF3899 domain-containing protein [Bacillota bacterium]
MTGMKALDREKIKRSLIWGLAVGALGAFAVRRDENALHFLSNAFFFGGIFQLVYALFELTLHLGFYNGVIYSFKKIVESFTVKNYDPKTSEIKSRPEYESTQKRGAVMKEHLLVSAAFILLSLVLALCV